MINLLKWHNMNSYFIYHSEKFQGPFSTEEIASLLRQNVVTVQEYLYDLQFRCIFQIGEIEDFKNFLPPAPPAFRPHEDYLVCRNNVIEGPFRKEKISAMLKNKKLLAYDYVTSWGETSWMIINNIPEFKDFLIPAPEEKSLNFYNTMEEGKEINTIVRQDLIKDIQLTPGIIRKNPRTPYSSTAAVIHNDKSYIGQCTTLSISGCFVQTQTGPFKTGDEITVIIRPDTIDMQIEAQAKIMSLNDGNIKGVGVQFLSLSNEVRMEIQKFVNRYINMIKKRNG